MKLKGGARQLIEVLRRAIGVCAPACLVGGLQARLDDKISKVPSASVIQRNEVALDLGLCKMRQQSYVSECVRYLWSDSSVQLGYDLLWAQCHEIPKAELIPTFKAFLDLTFFIRMYAQRHHEQNQQFGDDEQVGGKELPLEDTWMPMLRQMQNIAEHIYMPGNLASGHRTLIHKAEALVNMFCFDLPLQESLQEYTDSFFGHTSDMGVEFSLPDMCVDDVNTLVPPFFNRSNLSLDTEREVLETLAPAAPADPAPDTVEPAPPVYPKVFLKTAFPIYGLQHFTNNMNEDIHKALLHWDPFFLELKNFEYLLGVRERRRRFVVSCVLGSPMQSQQHRLDHWSAQLYEKRWKCVIRFLKHLSVLLQFFRVCWNRDKYVNHGDVALDIQQQDAPDDNPVGEFDPDALTKSIKSNFFNRYVHFSLRAVLSDSVSRNRENIFWEAFHLCMESFPFPFTLPHVLSWPLI